MLQEFIHQHPFAAIVVNTADGLEANHVPLVLDTTRGHFGTLRGHIARANPMWQMAPTGSNVLVIFQGANRYISPGWYPSKAEHGKVVPTWNYVVAHARGNINWFHDLAWLRNFLETITNIHEGNHPTPWHVSDAPQEFVERQLGAIVGFEVPISHLTGKWKLSQNRSETDRAGVISALESQSERSTQAMATLMAQTDPKRRIGR